MYTRSLGYVLVGSGPVDGSVEGLSALAGVQLTISLCAFHCSGDVGYRNAQRWTERRQYLRVGFHHYGAPELSLSGMMEPGVGCLGHTMLQQGPVTL